MKNIKLLIVFTALSILASSCKRVEVDYRPINSQLEFGQIYNESVEFVSQQSAIVTDTVYLHVIVKGSAPTTKSYIKLTQFDTTSTLSKAIPGVHYVPFDDPSMKELLSLNPGQLEADIPIVILRDESLKQESFQLDFRISTNDYFQRGIDVTNKVRITMSDKLVQPSNWIYFPPRILFFLGPYGSVKHRFIIDQSGEPWDSNFIQYHVNPDAGLQTYYLNKFKADLIRVNQERENEGLPPLRENPDDPATAVVFP